MTTPDERLRKRRWRLFLAIEVALLLIAIALFPGAAAPIRRTDWFFAASCIVIGWLAFTLPIAVLYLVGHPPIITLAPLLPSAEVTAFWRELAARPVLSDAEFYARFYAGSGIPKDMPARVRRFLVEQFDPIVGRAVPADSLLVLTEGLEYAELLLEVGEEFELHFGRDNAPKVGTLDDLIRLVHARLSPAGS